VHDLLERLRGGLIVSVQASAGSPLDDPSVIAALAEAAQNGGAAAVRIASIAHIRAVRRRVGVPVVGIVKREVSEDLPYITVAPEEAREILRAGAEIVAFDATGRPRPRSVTTEAMIDGIHTGGGLAMADCAREADGRTALHAGADLIATTLCGYTKETRGAKLPALELVAAFASLGAFSVCEGGVASPAAAREAAKAGADAVVVGAAITNIERVVASFAAELQRSSRP